MKRNLVLITTSIIIATLLISVFPGNVDSKVITELGNPGNPLEKTITLNGNVPPLLDATTYVDIPMGRDHIMSNSYFTVSPVDAGDGEFALNPTVDVGVDGDIEWTYKGGGYGDFGHQKLFSDDFKKKTLKYNTAGTNSQTSVKVPRDARVVDARLNIEGRLSEPAFKGTSLDLDTGFDGALYVDTGDIDGDGIKDVVVTSSNTISTKTDIAWYKTPSPPGNTDWNQNVVTKTLQHAYRVKLADLDGDGDLDIVCTTFNQNIANTGIFWFENKDMSGPGTGDGSQWESAKRIDTSSVSYPMHIDIGDLDGDGDLDIVAANNNWNIRNIYAFENTDPVNATSWNRKTVYQEPAGNWGYIGGVAIGNINEKSSSRMDIAFSFYSWQGRIDWLENDGTPFTGSWTNHNIRATKTGSPTTYEYYPKWIQIGDINNDNKNDVAVVKEYQGSQYGVWWYSNPGDPKNTTAMWDRTSVYGSTYYPSDLILTDINGDNDLDILTTSSRTTSWETYHKFHYVENKNGLGTSWEHKLIDGGLSGITGIAVANLDKGSGVDSDLDLIAAGSDAGEIKWYENTGTVSGMATFSNRFVDDAGIADPNDVEILDVDNDGDNDFIVSGKKSGDIQWFETPDNPYETSWNSYYIDPSLASATQIALGDLDGDGDTDIAATSFDGREWSPQSYGEVVWYEHPDGDPKAVSSWTKTVVDNVANGAYGVDIADIDNDGKNDIVATMYYSSTANYYRNDLGNGTKWTKYVVGTGLSRYPTAIKVADMDLDKDLDLVVCIGYSYTWGVTAGVLWIENPGNPTLKWTKHTIYKNINSVQDLVVIDVDDNNYPDVIITTGYGYSEKPNWVREYKSIYWYENPMPKTTSGEWAEHRISSTSILGGTFLFVDDIGNDGYIDVIASSGWREWSSTFGDNAIYWFEEPDEPLQASSWERYTVMTNIEQPRGVAVADVDGAGLKDIIALGSGVNEIWWQRVNMSYPRDVTLNVGGIGDVDFTYEGQVSTPRTTQNMALTFKEVLSDASTAWETDEYGNEISEIFFEVSSPVVGRVGINTIDILYQYDAKVEINPHNTYLFNELNEIIPDEDTGTISVNIGVTSQKPATMKIGNIFINYNSPPALEKEIPSDRHVMEGDSINYLFNLHNYFSDDIDEPENLFYRVEENSQSDKVWVFVTDMKYIKVSATKDSDWSGSTDIKVSAMDSMGAKTLSNKFTITIDNDNDPPSVGEPLPNFEIYEGQTTFLLDMNKADYFADIDSDILYYRAVVDESFKNYLRIDFDPDNNMYATAIGDKHDNNIPVHIYCDDQDLSGLTVDELESLGVVQDVFVDILNVNDAPMWINFPAELEIEEDYKITHGKVYKWLNLNDFSYDIDNKEFDLSYSVVKNTNSTYFHVTVDKNDWLYIDNALVENHIGQTFVTLRMTDGSKFADISFWVKTINLNDKPTLRINSPENYATVSGEVIIHGTATDIEGLDKVMVRVNDGEWQRITGTNTWEFIWDTSSLADGDYLLSFQAFDNDPINQKPSDTEMIHLVVKNIDNDPDNDGVTGNNDKFPYEPSQWSDTDGDNYGDDPNGYNPDQFPEDPTEWSDSDGDGYGNNRDKFPYDPTQWDDTDNDGYGDNQWGNNPDFNIMDSSVGGAEIEEKSDDSSGKSNAIFLWYIVVAVLIIYFVVTFMFNRHYKPPAQS